MQVSHRFTTSSAVFDDGHLVSCAGLVPVMTLAQQSRLSVLLEQNEVPPEKWTGVTRLE